MLRYISFIDRCNRLIDRCNRLIDRCNRLIYRQKDRYKKYINRQISQINDIIVKYYRYRSDNE